MSDKNIKIVKVDPTGFFVKKDEESKVSSDSEVSSVTSISSGGSTDSESDSESRLNPLPGVNANVAVEKVIDTPAESVVETKNSEDMMQANNYLSTSIPKVETKIEQVKVSNIPFQSNLEDTESRTESDTDTRSSRSRSSKSSGSSSSYTGTDSDEEVIDMTDNQLYTVMAAVLEDEDGNNVSDNLNSINRHLEKHNDNMEKLLNEYIEINRDRSKERRYMEQMAQAINNQNRLLEKMTSVFEIFIKSSGVKLEKTPRNIPEDINEEDEEKVENKKIFKPEKSDKIRRRIETPENTIKSSKLIVSKM